LLFSRRGDLVNKNTNRRILVVGSAVAALALTMLLVVGLTGCAPKKTAKAPERATNDEPYDFEKEGTIPPPEETDVTPEADVEELPMEDDSVVAEDVEAPKDTTKAVPPPGPGGPAGVSGKDGSFAVPVYRVQIMATSSEQSAMDLKSRVEKRLGFAAYVSFVDGMYKVRVGDSGTRGEAEKVRTRCRQAGYTDAWIVTDVLKGKS
jgi:hypothetical protein